MELTLTTEGYMEYLQRAYEKIHANGEYVTALDLATGDGDHWSNLDMGFEKLLEASGEIKQMELFDAFKKISTILMSVIGGSGGALYGSAYLEAAKTVKGKQVLHIQDICEIIDAMLHGIMKRGKSKPQDKTMIDALFPAVTCFKSCLAEKLPEKETFERVKQAAKEGAESTREMQAVRGRAYYQANKGVGHLDPGAVTMAYQIETLMDYLQENLL